MIFGKDTPLKRCDKVGGRAREAKQSNAMGIVN